MIEGVFTARYELRVQIEFKLLVSFIGLMFTQYRLRSFLSLFGNNISTYPAGPVSEPLSLGFNTLCVYMGDN